ncbi:MAG: hypothetical protein AAFV72_21280 [Cyanobacteria bacterium J06635_1]
MNDSSYEKLNQLLKLYPHAWGKRRLRRDGKGRFLRYFEDCRALIHENLRQVLQQEARYEEAVPHAILAETYSCRIDNRIYAYLKKKWDGKEKPERPDLYTEWKNFRTLKELNVDFEEFPELKSTESLLQALRKTALLPMLQSYAQKLSHDFKKSDSEVIADVQQILQKL